MLRTGSTDFTDQEIGQSLKLGGAANRKKMKSSFPFFLPAPLPSAGLASGSELRSDFKLHGVRKGRREVVRRLVGLRRLEYKQRNRVNPCNLWISLCYFPFSVALISVPGSRFLVLGGKLKAKKARSRKP